MTRALRLPSRFIAAAAALGAIASVTLASGVARAQQPGFTLDRLQVPSAPDDTLMIARPVTQPVPIFFAQLGIGYSYNPLKTDNIYSVGNQRLLSVKPARGVIQDQLGVYTAIGAQAFNRFTVTIAFPFTPFQDGQNPPYSTSSLVNNQKTTAVDPNGPGAGDVRLDLRGVIARTQNQRGAVGASLSAFAPTGTNANLNGDGKASAIISVQGEYGLSGKFPLVFMLTTGVVFRTTASINDPVNASGLGIGDEWRWQLGAFLPIKDGKYRIGATIAGQTGIESDGTVIGNTFFTKQNTPIEWNLEGRMKFGPEDHWWAGLSAGSFINPGYGAPDLRVVGLVGTYVPILDWLSASPDPKDKKLAKRAKWREEHSIDSDNDGIPDDLDACPMEAEDHQGGDPSDGCPMPPDRDGDGIADQFDKCPDQPEDKDGVDDNDGCPEADADNDGVPDAQDACPHEPGKASPDPKKNGCPQFISMQGDIVKMLQQVHFATGSATILADSFPMLQEVVNLLKANQTIKRMSIEGHTDNTGNAVMNKTLSQARADSVMAWLVSHGTEAARLEAHGYGQEKPIDTNATKEGRSNNRRVEFKIVDQSGK